MNILSQVLVRTYTTIFKKITDKETDGFALRKIQGEIQGKMKTPLTTLGKFTSNSAMENLRARNISLVVSSSLTANKENWDFKDGYLRIGYKINIILNDRKLKRLIPQVKIF